MQIKKGNTRIAILFPLFGLVIKVPRVYKSFAKTRYFLPKGIYNNWFEFIFFLLTQHGFCWPTYFSLFGLCNIQKYGTEVKSNGREDDLWVKFFWESLYPVIKDLPVDDPHHLHSHKNYIISGDRVYLIDYGDLVTRQTLLARKKELELLLIKLP